MYFLDIETLGVSSETVILSVALLYFDEKVEGHTWESLYDSTYFVKLSVRDQVENYNRVVDKDTIAWWKNQGDLTREKSFTPKKSDLSAKEGISQLQQYVRDKSKFPKKELVWVRGSIDQVALDSLFKAVVGQERLFPFWNYRDIRTFVDFNTETGARGYAEIDPERYPGTWNKDIVVKHNPIDDVVLDCLQLIYGK